MATSRNAVAAWEALFRAQVSVMHYLQADFPSEDLSLNEYDVLFNLSRQPDHQVRIRELNEQLLITQSSVSRMIDRLAARKFVLKLKDAEDARGIIVALTPAGYELFKQVARGHMNSINERVGGSLSDDELVTLAELCEKLRDGASTSPPESENPAT